MNNHIYQFLVEERNYEFEQINRNAWKYESLRKNRSMANKGLLKSFSKKRTS